MNTLPPVCDLLQGMDATLLHQTRELTAQERNEDNENS